MELSAVKMLIYMEEMERHGVARPPDQGITQVGPTLMRYGTAAQQEPPEVRRVLGEGRICMAD